MKEVQTASRPRLDASERCRVERELIAASLHDEELIVAIRSGDCVALAELYDRYAAQLLRAALPRLRQRADAEDLVHDVFLEAWQCAGSYARERGSVRCWLLVRLRSRLLDLGRKRRVSQSVIERVSMSEAETSRRAPEVEASLDRPRIDAALRSLRLENADVLRLHYLDELSYEEIAQRIGIPVGTVKSRYSAGMLGVRRWLGTDSAPRASVRRRSTVACEYQE